MLPTLSLIIDIAILTALIATIFYAIRLSKSLNNFKNHRKEFDALMMILSKNIEQAYGAIDSLREAGQESGQELKDATGDARFLIDELKQVNEASDSLAYRLEKLATKSRKNMTGSDESADNNADYNVGENTESKTPSWQDSLPVRDHAEENEEVGGFAIQDKDYDASVVKDVDFKARDAGNTNKSFASQAEKDLYEALHKNKK